MDHMHPELDKIRIVLCGDHFQRLAADDVCGYCPSKVENEMRVRSMAEDLKRHDELGDRAIIAELTSIRNAQKNIDKTLHSLVEKVQGSGSGNDGIAHRLLIVETKLNQAAKSLSVNIAIAGVVLSTILSALGLFVNLR